MAVRWVGVGGIPGVRFLKHHRSDDADQIKSYKLSIALVVSLSEIKSKICATDEILNF